MSDRAKQRGRMAVCPADRCKGEFALIHAKLDRLDEAIRGNSKPGIQLRLDRLEMAEATRSKLLWAITMSVISMLIMNAWRLFA